MTFLPRSCWRDAGALGGHGLRLQGLDVGREAQNLLLGHQALERGHDGLIPGHNLSFRLQNGFADVTFVGSHGGTIGEQHLGAINAIERGAAAGAVGYMAGGAGQLREELLARGNRTDVSALVGEPGGVFGGIHHGHPATHHRVIRAAILRAEKVVLADLGGPEPHGVVASRNDVHFHAECGHVKVVDDVLAAQDQLDVAIDGDVQLVDLFAPGGLLQLPHPLLADDVDVQGIFRGGAVVDVNHGAPREHAERQNERDQGPPDFQRGVAMNFSANIAGVFPPVAEGRKNGQQRHQHGEKDRGDENIGEEGIHISREIGGLLRKEWQR